MYAPQEVYFCPKLQKKNNVLCLLRKKNNFERINTMYTVLMNTMIEFRTINSTDLINVFRKHNEAV